MQEITQWLSTNMLWMLAVLLIVYVGMSIIVFFLEDLILFRPEKLPGDFEFKYENLKFEEYIVKIKPGVNLSGIRFRAENPVGVVFYLKGNSRSIKGWGKFAIDFIRYNYDVVMVDYRGFGKSTGSRSQESIKNDLQFVYDRLRERVDEKHIILYGRSMGSGFATKLASTNNPKMLILDAPYYSMSNVAGRFIPFLPMALFLKYTIPTYKWIKYVKCPIHIIHGTNDNLIPFKSSIKLSQVNPSITRLHPVVEGGHNNLHNFESYHETLSQILSGKQTEFDRENSSLNYIRKKR